MPTTAMTTRESAEQALARLNAILPPTHVLDAELAAIDRRTQRGMLLFATICVLLLLVVMGERGYTATVVDRDHAVVYVELGIEER